MSELQAAIARILAEKKPESLRQLHYQLIGQVPKNRTMKKATENRRK